MDFVIQCLTQIEITEQICVTYTIVSGWVCVIISSHKFLKPFQNGISLICFSHFFTEVALYLSVDFDLPRAINLWQ